MVGDFFCDGTEFLEQELDNTIVIVIPMVLEIGISDSFLWAQDKDNAMPYRRTQGMHLASLGVQSLFVLRPRTIY